MDKDERCYGVSVVWRDGEGKASTATALPAINGEMSLEEAKEFIAMTLDSAAICITRNPAGGPVEYVTAAAIQPLLK